MSRSHQHARPLDHVALASLSAIGASSLWAMVLVNQWSELTAIGGLCREAVGAIGHCWACYPASALSLAALTFAGLAASSRTPANATAK